MRRSSSVALPVAQSFLNRQTTREIRDAKLPLQVLSNLLWAACGINRRNGPSSDVGLTAASASNSQEINLFVALESGAYLFEARHHRLLPIVSDDVRGMAVSHGQKSVAVNAPVQPLYVVDVGRLVNTSGFQEPGLQNPDIQKSCYFVDAGMIAANVYLFAASQRLAAWFHNCDKVRLRTSLNLRTEQRVLFGQSIGYPVTKFHS